MARRSFQQVANKKHLPMIKVIFDLQEALRKGGGPIPPKKVVDETMYDKEFNIIDSTRTSRS